jgi:hypothetical protein
MTIRVIHFVALVICLLRPPLQADGLLGKTQHLTSADQVPEGLAKSDWQSIRAAYDAGRHAFQPVEGGWQARNPGQQWNTTFDSRGFVAQLPQVIAAGEFADRDRLPGGAVEDALYSFETFAAEETVAHGE